MITPPKTNYKNICPMDWFLPYWMNWYNTPSVRSQIIKESPMKKLKWYRIYDENDNEYYEAAGPYTDEIGAPEFHFRITQIINNNRPSWIDSSDPELRLSENERLRWRTKLEAMNAMQKSNDEIWIDINKEAAESRAKVQAQSDEADLNGEPGIITGGSSPTT